MLKLVHGGVPETDDIHILSVPVDSLSAYFPGWEWAFSEVEPDDYSGVRSAANGDVIAIGRDGCIYDMCENLGYVGTIKEIKAFTNELVKDRGGWIPI